MANGAREARRTRRGRIDILPVGVQIRAPRASSSGKRGATPHISRRNTPMSKRKYLVLARGQRGSGGRSGPSPEQMQQMFAAFNAWKEKFKDSIFDIGAKLESEGRVVTASGAADGPFVEVKEVVGGFMIVSADSYDGAAEAVRAMPTPPRAAFEIRGVTAQL